MYFSRGLLLAVGSIAAVALALMFFGAAQAAVSNASRVDAGPDIEVRVSEGFDVVPGGYYEDPPQVELSGSWWDLDNRTDTTPYDGDLTNDKDEFGIVFHHPGFSSVGTWLITFWVNYTDGPTVSDGRLISVVANLPPTLQGPPTPPTGFAGDPIEFVVTAMDPDTPESSLVFAWDFDVSSDSDVNGVPDDDLDSTSKINVFHTYAAEGTYTARITVTDDFGEEAMLFVTAYVTRPPGVCGHVVEIPTSQMDFADTVTVRKQCWVSYRINVTEGRTYEYTVNVSNDVPVFVMVQTSADQFDTYRLRASTVAYRPEWSAVADPLLNATHRFVADYNGLAFVTVDNGFLFALDPGHPSVLTVSVKRVPDLTGPLVAGVAPGEVPAGADALITVTITDHDGVENATLYYRAEGATGFSSLTMVRTGPFTFAAVIPGRDVHGTLEYYVEAQDSGGNLGRSPSSGTVAIHATGGVGAQPAVSGLALMAIVAGTAAGLAAVVMFVRQRRAK